MLQVKDMVSDKQEEVTALESRLADLDKEFEWKKEVSGSYLVQSSRDN